MESVFENPFEVVPGVRFLDQRNLLRRTFGDHAAAVVPALGADVDDVVGGLHDVEIVFAVFGAGLHLLALHPKRHIPRELQQRASSLAAYGVSFHACGNTMMSMRWTEKDLVDYAKVVPVGAEDLMLLQEKGFAYLSW